MNSNSIIAAASQTHKSTSNQDFFETVNNKNLLFAGVIVADGLGSHARSELSSKFAVESLKRKLEDCETLMVLDFDKFFNEIKHELKEYALKSLTDEERLNNPFGTTLLCALECEDVYKIAYVGNGAIFHVSGGFNLFGSKRYIPWNVNNLLNPHTVEEGGKSAMYKFISINDEISCKPTLIQISKSEDVFGDIIIIASDGVYTNDELKIGKDDDGVVWIMGEESEILLLNKLDLYFKENRDLNEKNLQQTLDHFLTQMKEKNIMHDDTTLGVIISPKVVCFQQTLKKKRSNETSANT